MFILPSCEQVCLNKRQRISLTFKGESVGLQQLRRLFLQKPRKALVQTNKTETNYTL